MGDAIRKHKMKHHTNHSMGRKKTSFELADQLLQHDPGASVEMIATVLSQWRILIDDDTRVACETEEKQRLHPVGD
jgi:hypothetical protein